MEFTVRQVADLLNGKIEGDSEKKVFRLTKIEEGAEGGLSFLANPIYTPYIYTTNATAVIVNNDFVPDQEVKTVLIRVENAYAAFAQLLEIYNQIKLNKTGISSLSFISKTAKIGSNAYVGEFAYIGENVIVGNNVKIYPHCYIGDNVVIGDNTTLFAGVRIYSDNCIGSHCNIHSGVVVGADGFGFAQQDGCNYSKVAQTGNVVIEDYVEIGANTTIDRATLGSTVIKQGVKLDNLIQVAHNVEIGENTVIAGQTGIAGSSKIGRNCMIGGQVGIVGHLKISDNVKIAAQSGIQAKTIAPNQILQGSPAFDISEYRRAYVHFRNFNKIVSRIDQLEKQLNKLQNNK